MKIIFLDIDGPLAWGTWGDGRVKIDEHTTIPYPWVQEDCDALSEILTKTDARVVISSDWRKHYSIKHMEVIFMHYKIPPWNLLDYTTMYNRRKKMSSSMEFDRACQIIQWVKNNKIKDWVAIDDLGLSGIFKNMGYPKYRHIQVDGDFGYGGRLRDKVEDVIKILNKNENSTYSSRQ